MAYPTVTQAFFKIAFSQSGYLSYGMAGCIHPCYSLSRFLQSRKHAVLIFLLKFTMMLKHCVSIMAIFS